jgi:hypothetical protein
VREGYDVLGTDWYVAIDYRYSGNRMVFGGVGKRDEGRLAAFSFANGKFHWTAPVPAKVKRVAEEVVRKRPEA